MDPRSKKCKTCLHWDTEERAEGFGVCTIDPPVVDIPFLLFVLQEYGAVSEKLFVDMASPEAGFWTQPTTADFARCSQWQGG